MACPQPCSEARERRVGIEGARVRHKCQLHLITRPLDAQLQVAECALARALIVRREVFKVREAAADGLDRAIDRRMVRRVAPLVVTAWHHVVRARLEHADDGGAFASGPHGDAGCSARAARRCRDAVQTDAVLREEFVSLCEQRRVSISADRP